MHNQTTLPVFVAKGGDKALSLRLVCKLANYHNYEYRSTKASHYSVLMEADGTRIHGYILKKSQIGKRIVELLDDGQMHRLTLEIRQIGPTGESLKHSDSDGSIVAITKFISESWVLPD